MAVAAPRRRADGDEHGIGALRTRLGEVGREGQPALAHVLGDEIVEPRLVDRHLACAAARRSWPDPCRRR